MPRQAMSLCASPGTGGPGAEGADQHPAPRLAPHTARVADVLARWREAEREWLAADPLGEDAARLEAEVALLRDEYQALTHDDATDPSQP